MFPVLPGGSDRHVVTSTPPATYTVQPHDTVQTVAAAHNVTPEELSRHNGISADTPLHVGQTLKLPANAVAPTFVKDKAPSRPQTPAEKTDAAIDKYHEAVKQRKTALENAPQNMGVRSEIRKTQDAAVAKAKKVMDKAIKSEIDGVVADRTRGVPGQYRTPTPKIIDSAGKAILARNKGNGSEVTGAVKDAIQDDQTDAKAQSLIPSYEGDWTAAEKLEGIDLKGQPQAVIDKVLADPRVQKWIKQAAHDATTKPTTDDVKYLAGLGKSLPQPLASKVIQQWWASQDTSSLMVTNGATSLAATDPDVYKNLATIYQTLAGTPEGERVQQDIASTMAGKNADNATPAQGTFSRAIGTGADPALALAVAAQLQSSGKTAQARQILGSVNSGMLNLQKVKLAGDVKHYAEITRDLNWYVKNLGPAMTPAQKQKAIEDYIASKGEDWKKEMQEAKNRIVADARTLDRDINELQNLPDGLKEAYGKTAQGLLKQIGEDEGTQQAIEFAASQDPSIFEGEEGESAAKFWVEAGHKSKDFTAAIAKAYVTGNVLPQLKNLNPNDPASVAKARHALENLRGKATLLGINPKQLNAGVDQLEKVLGSLKSESIEDAIHGKGINALGKTKEEINKLPALSSGPSGLLFRTLAFGLTGAALINSAGELAEKPSFKNMIGTLALGVGFPQDTAALAAKVGLIDKGGSLGSWGLGASEAGEATEKFIGVLGTVYYLVGGSEALAQGDYPAVAFNAAAAAGIGLATFGEAAWAGPVGWGVALVSVIGLSWYEHVKEANHFENGTTVKFLEHAGFSHDAAVELSNESGDGYSPVPALVEYAKVCGYDLSDETQQKQFTDWVNGMSRDQLAHLRDDLHHTLDDTDGDVRKAGIAQARVDLGPSASQYSDDQLAVIGVRMLIGQLELKYDIGTLPQGPNYAYVGGGGGIPA